MSKEITKTTIKKYDENGKIIEHTETIVEKEIINDNIPNPIYPNTPVMPWQQPTIYKDNTGFPPNYILPNITTIK
jgi:hypothetical protein